MNDTNLKTAICDALAAWIRQRPDLDPADYIDTDSRGETRANGLAAYRRAQREVAIDKRDAEMLLVAVRGRDSISAADIVEAARHSFAGRLEIKVIPRSIQLGAMQESVPNGYEVEIEYTAGQDSTTEYRAAAAAVLASALWEHVRTDESTGDTLRQHFRKEFGSRLQRRWFN